MINRIAGNKRYGRSDIDAAYVEGIKAHMTRMFGNTNVPAVVTHGVKIPAGRV